MDITLERILSLIPKKEDGKFVHGAKKEFADSLGLAHNLVTMWEKGQSKSYRDKLYEISAKYNVSVEWLEGKTDIKNPAAPKNDGLSGLSDFEKRVIELLRSNSDFKAQTELGVEMANRKAAQKDG